MPINTPERGLKSVTRGPSWIITLTLVLVLVGTLDALLSYQAFSLFLDADLFGTAARDEAERQAGLIGGINALAATGILTVLCIMLPQTAARLLRNDQGGALARLPHALRMTLVVLFAVASIVLAAGIGAVRYMGQLSMSGSTVSSTFAAQALEEANLTGSSQNDATALMWAAFTAFLLFLAEALGFALASVKGGEAAHSEAYLIRMERRATALENKAAALNARADKLESDALATVDAREKALEIEVDERFRDLCMQNLPQSARDRAVWL